MIPGKIVRFLEQHANLAFAGTRDRDRVPYGHRVSGWHVNADARTLTALVPEPFTVNSTLALDAQLARVPIADPWTNERAQEWWKVNAPDEVKEV